MIIWTSQYRFWWEKKLTFANCARWICPNLSHLVITFETTLQVEVSVQYWELYLRVIDHSNKLTATFSKGPVTFLSQEQVDSLRRRNTYSCQYSSSSGRKMRWNPSSIEQCWNKNFKLLTLMMTQRQEALPNPSPVVKLTLTGKILQRRVWNWTESHHRKMRMRCEFAVRLHAAAQAQKDVHEVPHCPPLKHSSGEASPWLVKYLGPGETGFFSFQIELLLLEDWTGRIHCYDFFVGLLTGREWLTYYVCLLNVYFFTDK